MSVPSDIEEMVVRRMYRALATRAADGKTRNAPYDAWIVDPEIGGRLAEFMPPQKVRLWMKDGPVKEYARAREGLTRFAPYVSHPQEPIQEVITRALGPAWSVDPETMESKPLHIAAYAPGQPPLVVAWGPPNSFKEVVWCAIQSQAMGDKRTWILLVTTTPNHPLPPAKREELERIAQRCGLGLKLIERQ